MAFELKSKIDKAVEKYGGGDAKYQQQLKEEIRNYLGYQNFVDRMNEEANQQPDIIMGDNMTPQAAMSQLNSAMNYQAGEVDHYIGLAQQADKAASTIASSVGTGRRGGGSGSEQAFDLDFIQKEPENWMEREVQKYYMNPFKESGQMKDIEDLKKDLKIKRDQIKTMAGEAPGEGVEAYGETPETKLFSDEEISQYVDQKIPDPDTFQKSHYKALGFSDTIAENMLLTDKLADGDMSPAAAEIIRVSKPGVYDDAMLMQANEGLKDKRNLKYKPVEDQNGNKQLQLEMKGGNVDFKTLRKQYPNTAEEDLKRVMEPVYTRLAENDIQLAISERMPYLKGSNVSEVMDRPDIKNMVIELTSQYSGMFNSQDIKDMIAMEFQRQNANN